MGGSSGGGINVFFSAEDAEKWRKEAYQILTKELKDRGIKPPSYNNWDRVAKTGQFLLRLSIAVIFAFFIYSLFFSYGN